MRKKNYKGKYIKRSVGKEEGVCKTYEAIQISYLEVLQNSPDIAEICCNIPLEDEEAEEYTTDFLCVKADNDLMVRECIFRRHLLRPKTAHLLDISKEYWLRRGVEDWGLVINEEK